jgi:hypothetical protein
MSRALLLALATLATGCFKTNYQSGQTACSPAGECPSGFQCIDGRCYRPGEGSPDLSAYMDLGGDLPDLAQPDLSPILVPPAAVWISGGGGGGKSTGQSQLNMSMGGTSYTGRASAPGGATLELGQFPNASVE